MVDQPPEAAHIIDWFRWAHLVAGRQVSGPELIPVLGPVESYPRPERLVAFDRWKQVPEPSAAMLHFYVADPKLRRVLNNPGRYVAAAAGFSGVISPDFSVYRSMPPHQRVFSVWASRAVGAFFQHHGLAVVPRVRWAEPADYEFCFEGLPSRSVLAVSPHGCSRSGLDRHYFRLGVKEMLDRLRPTVVLVHGPMPSDVFGALGGGTQFMRFPSDIERAHRGAA